MKVIVLAAMLGLVSLNASAQTDWTRDLSQRIQLHGYAQGGYTYSNKDGIETNTFETKRILFWINGQITPRWSFCFMHDFAGIVQEFYTDFRITENDALKVRIGQFKTGFSYENALSPTSVEAIDVCSEAVTYLAMCGSDPLLGVQYGRDLGISLQGQTESGMLLYKLELMNGQGIQSFARKDLNNKKDLIAHLEVRPLDGLNIIATGQTGYGTSVSTSIYNPYITVGQDYKRDRYSLGAALRKDGYGVRAEYLEGKDADVTSRGAYVTGNVRLLSLPEETSLDLVGSYDWFNYNTDLDMEQHKAILGLQYWFFKQCRVQLQYVYKSAYTGTAGFVKGDNHALMCQMQIRFN